MSADVVQALIQAGAHINCEKEHGTTLLHYAVVKSDVEITKILLNNSSTAKINKADTNGNTPLHLAIKYGTDENVKAILETGAIGSINVRNYHGNTPLHLALLYRRNIGIINALLEKGAAASIDTQNNKFETPLDIAEENRDIYKIRFLLEFSDKMPEQFLAIYTSLKKRSRLNNREIEILHPYTLRSRILLPLITIIQMTAIIAVAAGITLIALSAPLLPILAPIIGGLVVLVLASIAKKHIQQNRIKKEYKTAVGNPITANKEMHNNQGLPTLERTNCTDLPEAEVTITPPDPVAADVTRVTARLNLPVATEFNPHSTQGEFPEAEVIERESDNRLEGVNSSNRGQAEAVHSTNSGSIKPR